MRKLHSKCTEGVEQITSNWNVLKKISFIFLAGEVGKTFEPNLEDCIGFIHVYMMGGEDFLA